MVERSQKGTPGKEPLPHIWGTLPTPASSGAAPSGSPPQIHLTDRGLLGPVSFHLNV